MGDEHFIKEALKEVHEKIQRAANNRPDNLQYIIPRLVAVSKTKPVELIVEAYKEGQRHFGENYVQELVAKASDKRILDNCPDIKWHFIGHLQKNKISKVIAISNLYIVETIHSSRLATSLNENWPKHHPNETLNVYVQVNTSDEDEKNGIAPTEAPSLAKFIIENCPNLKFCGIMTIGKYGYDISQGPNPDFLLLVKCKDDLCRELELPADQVELSMGMSSDYDHAIELGSTNVRVGTSIFGYRERKVKNKDAGDQK